MTKTVGRSRRIPLVLCYHGVSDAWENELAVMLASFEGQIRGLLQKGYVPVVARDVVAHSGKLFHVTFDDALRSIPGALDVLASLGVYSTVFVCSDLPDGGLPAPVDRPPAVDPIHDKTLRWDELRDLVDRGVEIGSHSQSHPDLTELSDEELHREVGGSKQRLEDELGRRCSFLAYPFGEHDDRVRRATRAAGYDAAFALLGSLRTLDVFAIPRVGIYRSDGARRASLKMSLLGRHAAAVRGSFRRARTRSG